MTQAVQNTQKKVISIVADVLNVDQKTVTMETSFDQLGADSLDMLELVMKIEESFEIEISDEATIEITTVGQAVHAINNARSA